MTNSFVVLNNTHSLNDYLKNDALKNQDNWLSVTRLMYSDEHLIGFYTIVPDTLHL